MICQKIRPIDLPIDSNDLRQAQQMRAAAAGVHRRGGGLS